MGDKDKESAANNLEELAVAEGNELKGFGVRHQQCLVLFFCIAVCYSMRSCMGVALVAMTENGNATKDTSNIESNGLLNVLLFSPPHPTFQWSKKWQDFILSSFQWGYMTLQIPAGQLAHRFGARLLLTGALAVNCIVSFCIPWAAYYGGPTCLVVCRVLQGLTQACLMPSLHMFFGKWTPLEERARLSGYTTGGSVIGVVLGLPLTGFIAASNLGWPGIFRFYGLLSGIVAIAIFYVVADTPAQHSKISTAERLYIEEGLGLKGGSGKHLPVPWKKILRSRAVYALVLTHIGQTWGQITLYTEVPAFMANVMGVNIKANGVLSALPFMVMWITNFFFSWLADMLIVKKITNVTIARKICNSLGYIPAAIGLVVLAYVPKNIYVVESLLVCICAFKVAAHSGFQVNHVDTSPNFAGTLMSISNFVSQSVGSLAPITAGFILTDVSDEYLWRKVFFVAAAIYFITNMVYLVLGSAEKAEWDDGSPTDKIDLKIGDEIQPMIDSMNNDSQGKQKI